jgi:hypothetical protein
MGVLPPPPPTPQPTLVSIPPPLTNGAQPTLGMFRYEFNYQTPTPQTNQTTRRY